ncbi:MAG: 4a-hydroxytetrahydrobiopterin dehydratase [Schleiferiaceae bacterium]|nr:4a-hydroxytetrahydrobiopterin dehydratase [Schleiferiaceae bacterium]
MNWENREEALYAELSFADFITAWAFVTKVALLAEKHAHHPEITITYNKVKLKLTTHDAGNTITEKDRKLAAAIANL